MRSPIAWLDDQIGVPPVAPGRPGDPGLFGPGSMVWRIGRERILLLGGPTALLMQVAHPLIAEAVSEHSGFEQDPMRRLRGTLEAVLAIAYGDRSQAERAAAGVRAIHSRVHGTLSETLGPHPAGTPYDAADPELALWVHATLVWTALKGFDTFVRRLSQEEREGYWQETKRFAELFGVTREMLPERHSDFVAYLGRQLNGPALAVGPAGRALGRRILDPPVPPGLRPVVPLTRVITAGLLPDRLRRRFALPWGSLDRALFVAAGASVRATVRMWPPSVRFWPHVRAARDRVGEGSVTD